MVMASSLPNLHLLPSDSYVVMSDTLTTDVVARPRHFPVGAPLRQLPRITFITDPSEHLPDQSTTTPTLTDRRLVLNVATLGTGTSLVTGTIAAFLSLASSTISPPKSQYYLHARKDTSAQMCAWAFGTASVSAILGPCAVRSFSAQWTLVTSSLIVVLFLMASVLLVQESALIVSGVLLGTAIGSLDSAYNILLLDLAARLAVTTEDDGILARLTRLCAFLKRTGHAFVHLITAFILSNTEVQHVDGEERSCGIRIEPTDIGRIAQDFLRAETLFDVTSNATSLSSTSNPRSHRGDLVLVSIYLGCTLLGVAILTAFLDKLKVQISHDASERPTNLALIWDAVSSTGDRKFWLAAPLMIFLGFQEGFLYDDFNRWYVGCSLGSAAISRAMFTYSAMQGLASVGTSHLAEHGARAAIATAAAVCYAALLAILLLWKPDVEDAPVFYVVAAVWGLCVAIWDTLSFGLMTALQSSPWAPFASACCSLRYVGVCVAFASHSLDVRAKIYALAAILAAAIIPYAFLEYRLHRCRHLRHILNLI